MAQELTVESKERLKGELAPGESIIWSMQLGDREYHRERRGCLFSASFLVLWFGLPSLCFGNYIIWSLCAAPLCIGVVLIRKNLKTYYHANHESAYVITDRRVIVLSGKWLSQRTFATAQVWSFYSTELRDRKTVVRKDGAGDIVLWRKGPGRWCDQGAEFTIGFLNVPNISKIDRLIEGLERNKMPPDIRNGRSLDEDICLRLGWNHRDIHTPSDKAPTSYTSVLVLVVGVAFLTFGVYATGSAFKLWGLGEPDEDPFWQEQFWRMVEMWLGVGFVLGGLMCIGAAFALAREIAGRNDDTAQPTSAGDVASRGAPEK